MPDAPTVRPARRADLAAVAEIYAHYVTTSVATFELDPPDVAEWGRRFDKIAAAGLPFLVAESDEAIAGYAYCGPWNVRPAYRATVEDSIYVAPGGIRKGCGAALMTALLCGCAVAGLREVVAVIADTGDPSSVALHRRFGFV